MVTPKYWAIDFASSMFDGVASFAEASVNTYSGDPQSGPSYNASKIPLRVNSGQSLPPVADSLLMASTNNAPCVLSLKVTGPVAVDDKVGL